jgi:RNA polymerase sigma-70 factor (ECF subfamily)
MGEADMTVRFAAGEPAAVAEVYQSYGRLVYTVAHRVLGDPGLAEEATKQTFLRVRQLAATVVPGRGLEPWLASIAGTTAIDIRRRQQTQPRPSDLADPPSHRSEPTDRDPPAPNNHDAWLLRRALDALPAQDRELIRLLHHGGLTRGEIAQRLAIPLVAIKGRSAGAHRNLARQLGRLRADGHLGNSQLPFLGEPQLERG